MGFDDEYLIIFLILDINSNLKFRIHEKKWIDGDDKRTKAINDRRTERVRRILRQMQFFPWLTQWIVHDDTLNIIPNPITINPITTTTIAASNICRLRKITNISTTTITNNNETGITQ